MRTWLTSDTHFSHAKINDLSGRPFDTVGEMNDAILDGINSTVPKDGRLVILGDVCMGKIDDSLQLLDRIEAAELVLIPGNHDRWSSAYKHSGSAEKQRQTREMWRQRYASSRPGRRTAVVPDIDPMYEVIDAGNEILTEFPWCVLSDEWVDHPLDKVVFSHYPRSGESSPDRPDRYAELRPITLGPIVHGHVHERWLTNGNQYNVGVDVNDFKPVSEDTLIAWVNGLV